MPGLVSLLEDIDNLQETQIAIARLEKLATHYDLPSIKMTICSMRKRARVLEQRILEYIQEEPDARSGPC